MLTWKDVPDALGLVGPEVVSFVGGGGKTTALFALAAHRAGRCIVTTTTKMGAERTGGLPVLLDPSDADLADALQQQDAVIVWSGSDGQRAFGIEPDRCARYLAVADTVAVEADGSRRRPFKAPRAYEPVVPTSTTTLVGCVGRSAIGVPIEVGCHRPDRVAAIAGADPSDVLTPERLVRVLLDEAGSRKGQPPGARFAVLLNRVTAADAALVDDIQSRVAALDSKVAVLAVGDVERAGLPDMV